jgi:hypothetical protein
MLQKCLNAKRIIEAGAKAIQEWSQLKADLQKAIERHQKVVSKMSEAHGATGAKKTRKTNKMGFQIEDTDPASLKDFDAIMNTYPVTTYSLDEIHNSTLETAWVLRVPGKDVSTMLGLTCPDTMADVELIKKHFNEQFIGPFDAKADKKKAQAILLSHVRYDSCNFPHLLVASNLLVIY